MRAGWMRPSASRRLERQPGDLAPHAVEARQQHRARGVVDDEVDPGERLERADVAPLAADDAALELVGLELHHRHGGLHRVAAGHALHAPRRGCCARGGRRRAWSPPRPGGSGARCRGAARPRARAAGSACLAGAEAGDALELAQLLALVSLSCSRPRARGCAGGPRASARARSALGPAARATPRGRAGAPRAAPARRGGRAAPPPGRRAARRASRRRPRSRVSAGPAPRRLPGAAPRTPAAGAAPAAPPPRTLPPPRVPPARSPSLVAVAVVVERCGSAP